MLRLESREPGMFAGPLSLYIWPRRLPARTQDSQSWKARSTLAEVAICPLSSVVEFLLGKQATAGFDSLSGRHLRSVSQLVEEFVSDTNNV